MNQEPLWLLSDISISLRQLGTRSGKGGTSSKSTDYNRLTSYFFLIIL